VVDETGNLRAIGSLDQYDQVKLSCYVQTASFIACRTIDLPQHLHDMAQVLRMLTMQQFDFAILIFLREVTEAVVFTKAFDGQ